MRRDYWNGEATLLFVNKGASYKISTQTSIAFHVRNNHLENAMIKAL